MFDNPFKDSFVSIEVPGSQAMDLINGSPFIPSSSLQGELKKKWIILEGERVLVKGNYDGSIQQSLNEVFACGLHERQGLFPFMEYQIITDFILTNTDRHFNNFGMIRDSDTLEFLGPAPIFDNGNCLFYRSHVPKGKGLYDIAVTSFRKRETDMLKYVTRPDRIEIMALPQPEELYALLKRDESMPDMRRTDICEAYEAKIRMYADFMNGAPLWEYQYRK